MNKKTILLIVLSVIVFSYFGYIYFQRSGTTVFVDENDNIVAAHFMLKGKTLFKDIYHNRQLGMVYVSYIIQLVLHPQTLYHLILYHRLFVILMSTIFGGLLVFRFGYSALYTVIIFELIKYNSYGNLFQGESIIVYPIVYLMGIAIEGFIRKKITLFDTILTALFSYLVIFTRETYIPLVFCLFSLIFIRLKKRDKYLSVIILLLLSLVTISTVSLTDYIYNLTYANAYSSYGSEINLFKSIFYPFLVFIEGQYTYTRIIIVLLSLSFIISLFYTKRLVYFVILAFAVLRVVPPGTELFSAYKMLVWYALLIFIVASSINKNSKIPLGIFLFGILVFSLFSPQSVLWQKINKLNDFDIGYNRYFVYSQEINRLSKPGDTLYVDGYESLLFWPTKLPSSYKYTFYYPVVKNIKKYSDERMRMFTTNPPTFYFRDCLDPYQLYIPNFARPLYTQLMLNGKISCLFKKKE